MASAMIRTYRKLPVIITAMCYDGTNGSEVIEWTNGKSMYETVHPYGDRTGKLIIPTLEGCMTADVGDYIILGVRGEFYPCKPDVFWMTYEEV